MLTLPITLAVALDSAFFGAAATRSVAGDRVGSVPGPARRLRWFQALFDLSDAALTGCRS